MRDPNINIRRSDLVLVLEKFNISTNNIDNFIEDCNKYTCQDRLTIKKTKAATRKKINRLVQLDKNDVELFSGYLLAERSNNNHNLDYIKLIRVGTKDYTNLTEACNHALCFGTSFKLSKSDGMVEFIKIGLGLMKRKFSINRFSSLSSRIFTEYENKLLINNTELKVAAAKLAKYYYDKLESEIKITLTRNVSNDVFVNFIYAIQDMEKVSATAKDWVDSQFYGFAYMDIYPEVYQLHGDNSGLRYIKYKYSKKQKDKSKASSIDKTMMDSKTLKFFQNLKV